TVGSGQGKSAVRQTCLAYRKPGAQLPTFRCEPEGFLHALAEKFGYTDIDFDDDPLFSDAFKLTGDNEAALRQWFDDDRRRFLLDWPKWTLEAAEDSIVLYRQAHTFKPKELPEILDRTASAADRLLNDQANAGSG
ncbi:MAG: hypothetical protein R3336_05420, partial [Phycisphaeraceae bacterium]|nr:hypothetical protein [Phycisphaeraceae bacterium]